MLKSESLLTLIKLSNSPEFSVLPSAAKRGLMKALTLVASACEDQNARDQYWQNILHPLNNRFMSILQKPDFKKQYHEDKVRLSLTQCLESFIGECIFLNRQAVAE